MKEAVNHPDHYGGADNPYEAIKVIEAWGLGFCLGNTIKYISRAGKKGDALEDLRKARWYLDREISNLEAKISPVTEDIYKITLKDLTVEARFQQESEREG